MCEREFIIRLRTPVIIIPGFCPPVLDMGEFLHPARVPTCVRRPWYPGSQLPGGPNEDHTAHHPGLWLEL